jgi:hypothetical protein
VGPSRSSRRRATHRPLSRRFGSTPWRWSAVAASVALLVVAGGAVELVGGTGTAEASSTIWYAYAKGQAKAPTSCPETGTASRQCTLTEALSKAAAGSTVALATAGHAGVYVGNWTVSTAGTTSSAPLTIRPAPGTSQPTLGGNRGQPTGCGTGTCDGPVLTIGPKVHVDIEGVTIRHADNTTSVGLGGAIENIHGGIVSVSRSTFLDNYANADGGAIDNADITGTGTLIVTRSTFLGNYAENDDGGAIANADVDGHGTVIVSGSTFSGNSAINGDGGAIDSGDTRGNGRLVVSASTFLGNVAGRAGAIDNADNARGTLSVSASTFSGNVSALADAGAIDNADWGGTGTLTVSGSTFSGNKTIGDGGAIDNADNVATSRGTLIVSTSTFSGNIADVHGGAIDNADFGGRGLAVVATSTFSANSANNIYASNGARGGGVIGTGKRSTTWVVADIFNGPCLRLGGTWDDEGYNVGSDGTCLKGARGDVSHGANRLSPLAHHGGPTKTILPLKGNPAIDAVPYPTKVALYRSPVDLCPSTDQRGVRTTAKRSCTAGAVQEPG